MADHAAINGGATAAASPKVIGWLSSLIVGFAFPSGSSWRARPASGKQPSPGASRRRRRSRTRKWTRSSTAPSERSSPGSSTRSMRSLENVGGPPNGHTRHSSAISSCAVPTLWYCSIIESTCTWRDSSGAPSNVECDAPSCGTGTWSRPYVRSFATLNTSSDGALRDGRKSDAACLARSGTGPDCTSYDCGRNTKRTAGCEHSETPADRSSGDCSFWESCT